MKRIPPLLGFIAIATIGIGVTLAVYRTEEAATQSRFNAIAEEAVDRIEERLRQHVALLTATKALFAARAGHVSQSEFQVFIDGLHLGDRYRGIQGIGFARVIATGNEGVAEADIARNYGIARPIWPGTDQEHRSPIVLLEPQDVRNERALGYDMFSEASRRAAIQAAIADGQLHATAPVELVQEITTAKQAGFLAYLPYGGPLPGAMPEDAAPASAGAASGLVYAPFRASDLHAAALSRRLPLPIALETKDVSGPEPVLLYRTAGFEDVAKDALLTVVRPIAFGGRDWSIVVHETAAFRSTANHRFTLGVALVSALLLLAAVFTMLAQLRALASARALQALSERTVQEKDLMLQEMKHRLKNALARVIAIARRTAAGSDDLDGFLATYSARLNAMAAAQDMLTRSHWQRADLKELLSKELEQVFGSDLQSCTLEGPPVQLDEKTTQALSLTFHELATNGLKYSQIAEDGGALTVRWRIAEVAKARTLEIDWHERAAVAITPPEHQGFGAKLIDANIRGELGGTIERNFAAQGMMMRMTVPVDRSA